MARKKRMSKRAQAERDYRINSFVVLGGLLAFGVYFMMKGCETYENAKASPLEQKLEQVETKPADKPYSISEVVYKN